jgi:hypothetical protein
MDRTSFLSRNQANIPLPAAMPAAVISRMPTVNGISGLGVTPAPLTPTTLVQRLPSIVNPSAVDLSATCDPFTAWVAGNPLFAIGGLAVIAYFTILKGGKK